MGARRGPNVTVEALAVYKPQAGPQAAARQGTIWVRTSAGKWIPWDELRVTEQAATIGALTAMGLSFRSMWDAANEFIPWPNVGTPWAVRIPTAIYRQVMNTQKGARP